MKLHDERFQNAILVKEADYIKRRQVPDREKFRADFILGAIRTNPLPADMNTVFSRAAEAELYVFGSLVESQ